MTRSPPEAYEGAYVDFDDGPSSFANVEAIVEEVRFPLAAPFDVDMLRQELGMVARLHRLDIRRASEPTVSADRRYLQDLRRASRTMVKLVPLLQEAGAEFSPKPSTGLMQLLGRPMMIEIDARVAQEEARQAGSHGGANRRAEERRVRPEHIFGDSMPVDVLTTFHEISRIVAAAADRALKDLDQTAEQVRLNPDEDCVVALMKLYKRAFGRAIGFSNPGKSKTAGGPMIRFVAACCKVLGIRLKPASIAKIKQRRFPVEADNSA